MTHRNFLRLLIALGTVALAFVAVAAVIAAHYGSPGTGTSGDLRTIGGAAAPTPGYVAVSRLAPAISLPALNGTGTVSSDGTGPLAVNFWAADCSPCRREAPVLAAAAHALSGHVDFLGIDTTDVTRAARDFARAERLDYPLGSDPTETVGNRYDLAALPTTYFLSEDHRRIVGIYFGAMSRSELAGALWRAYKLRISPRALARASTNDSR